MVKERIKVKFHRPLPLQKNHYLAKSISDVSWSKFVEFLIFLAVVWSKTNSIDQLVPNFKNLAVVVVGILLLD